MPSVSPVRFSAHEFADIFNKLPRLPFPFDPMNLPSLVDLAQAIIVGGAHPDVVAIVVAYLAYLDRQAGGRWKKLPEHVRNWLQPYYAVNLGDVEYAENIDTVHGMHITVENRVHFTSTVNFSTLNDLRLLAHELQHCVQYDSIGGKAQFFIHYVVQGAQEIVRKQSLNVHDDIVLERDADAKAAAVTPRLALLLPERPDAYPAIPGRRYRLNARHSGLRLDVYDANHIEGGRVCQALPNSTDAQIWHLDPHPIYHEAMRLTASCSGKCLDVYGGSVHSGDRVCQASYNGTQAQAWIVTPHPRYPGYHLLRAHHSGKVLDVLGAHPGNNANVCQADFNDSAAQAWLFEAV